MQHIQLTVIGTLIYIVTIYREDYDDSTHLCNRIFFCFVIRDFFMFALLIVLDSYDIRLINECVYGTDKPAPAVKCQE